MQVSYSKHHIGHLSKQLNALNTTLAELLTQVRRQESTGKDLERRAGQLHRKNQGLQRLVTELQCQLAAGMQFRERLSERLALLEQRMQDAVPVGAGGLSLTQVTDNTKPFLQRQSQRIDELFAEVKMRRSQMHRRDALIQQLREKVNSKRKPSKESVKNGNGKKNLDM